VTAAAGPPAGALLAGVRARLADDLDTPGALALVDGWAEAALAGPGPDPDAPGQVRATVDALLGVPL
jgi:L-cysteine:1D-myo-inositol 2-amino-2-deoxy-alpha-D-glucopyranoside ligase